MSLGSVGYHNRATGTPLYRSMSTDVAASALFLPERLQLGPNNWLEFKLAIETILRTRDIPLAHLTSLDRPLLYDPRTKSCRVFASDPANPGQAMDDLNERWTAEDELCKAAIMLNVRPEHVRLTEYEHEQWTAGELWDALTRLDTQIREDEERKWLALRRVLLGMLFVLTLLVLYDVRFGGRLGL
ncbi:hypothetical protein K466DRAFT_592520 [Polyporus arcularius HHB13444]|uniref:Uncharacterized protein n=1 Tax=Polyporus arcularius HHB13444 TaxID=1314778 RepID=A0A5C3NNR5_9APHY|nr:hypothetical protein K466DRAFT_592520 [Polyporus arcularius HHB13444]